MTTSSSGWGTPPFQGRSFTGKREASWSTWGAGPYAGVGRWLDDEDVTALAEAPTDRRSVVARVLLGAVLAEAVLTVIASAGSGLPWSRLVNLLVVSNTISGLTLAVAGWPIAYYRPRNLIGWSLLVGGFFYAFTGTGIAVLAWAADSSWGWRFLATVVNGFGWNLALGLFIPLALTLFPEGRLPSPRWRWFVSLLVVNTVLLIVAGILEPLGGMPAELRHSGLSGESLAGAADVATHHLGGGLAAS